MLKTGFLVLLMALGSVAQAHLQYLDLGPQPVPCCMTTDASGNAYVAATLVESMSIAAKAMVIKIDPAHRVVYRFIFAGSRYDYPTALAVDSNGNLFVAGFASSPDFPVVNPLNRSAPPNGWRAFLAKIDPTGSQLLLSTFIAGAVSAMALDPAGNLYLTGAATPADFPVSPNAFRNTGTSFVMKLTNSGDHILMATFLGVGGTTTAIAVDSQGAVTVAGSAESNQFPTTAGAFQTVCNCGTVFGPNPLVHPLSSHTTSFVSRLSADGSRLIWSTFLGGPDENSLYSEDTARALALTSDGGVVVAGIAESPRFPVTPGAFQTRLLAKPAGVGLGGNLFISRLNASGTALAFSTYLGGSVLEEFYGLQLDAEEHPWVTGTTFSSDFPTLPGALALGNEFVVELSADGSSLLQALRLPSGGAGFGFALDSSGGQTLLGRTGSLIRIPPAGPSGISLFGLVNAAGPAVSGHVAPGEIISLYGAGLGPAPGVAAALDVDGKVAATLAGVQVTFDGIPAPLLYVGPNQINAVVPFEVAGQSSTSLQVVSAAATSPALELAVVPADPQIVALPSTIPRPRGLAYAAALNEDGTFNSINNPAKPGSVITFWVTGAGLFNTPLSDGAIAQPPLPLPAQPVSVFFDSAALTRPLEILYAGAAPSFVAGALQVNARLPQTLLTSGSHALKLQIGTTLSSEVHVWAQQ